MAVDLVTTPPPEWFIIVAVSVTSGTIFLSLMIATALAESSFARSTIRRARWISRISIVFSAAVIAHPLVTIEPLFHHSATRPGRGALGMLVLLSKGNT